MRPYFLSSCKMEGVLETGKNIFLSFIFNGNGGGKPGRYSVSLLNLNLAAGYVEEHGSGINGQIWKLF